MTGQVSGQLIQQKTRSNVVFTFIANCSLSVRRYPQDPLNVVEVHPKDAHIPVDFLLEIVILHTQPDKSVYGKSDENIVIEWGNALDLPITSYQRRYVTNEYLASVFYVRYKQVVIHVHKGDDTFLPEHVLYASCMETVYDFRSPDLFGRRGE